MGHDVKFVKYVKPVNIVKYEKYEKYKKFFYGSLWVMNIFLFRFSNRIFSCFTFTNFV